MTSKLYRELELIENSSTLQPFRQRLWTWLNAVIQALMAEPEFELRITQIVGNRDEILWEIYDSATRQTFYCMTENEVQNWLYTNYWRHHG